MLSSPKTQTNTRMNHLHLLCLLGSVSPVFLIRVVLDIDPKDMSQAIHQCKCLKTDPVIICNKVYAGFSYTDACNYVTCTERKKENGEATWMRKKVSIMKPTKIFGEHSCLYEYLEPDTCAARCNRLRKRLNYLIKIIRGGYRPSNESLVKVAYPIFEY